MSSQLEEYNRQLIEQCPIGLVLCRMDGTLIDINSTYAAILGRTVPETLNLSYAIESALLEALELTGHYGPDEQELMFPGD